MDARRHTLEVCVQAADIDVLGHVNNAVYVQWIEAVATAHAERIGMGLEALKALDVIPVLREHRIKYLRPALLGEVLEVGTLVTSMQGVRATRHNTIKRGETTLVESETLWAWLHPITGRPRAIPDVVYAAFGFPGH